MTAATTVKSRRIKRRNLVITAFIDHTEINLETAEQNVEHLVGIYIMSQYLSQRNGIGSVANKLTLVNIYSGAENTTADMASTDCTFRESAADFFVAPVNIVRPFYRYVVYIFGNGITYGKRLSLEHDILTNNRHTDRINLNAERQVLAALTLPLVFALAAPCRLKSGNADSHNQAFLA